MTKSLVFNDKQLPFITAIAFGLIALGASALGADNTIITLIGTLAGYVLGASR
jgi:hypothetical protein